MLKQCSTWRMRDRVACSQTHICTQWCWMPTQDRYYFSFSPSSSSPPFSLSFSSFSLSSLLSLSSFSVTSPSIFFCSFFYFLTVRVMYSPRFIQFLFFSLLLFFAHHTSTSSHIQDDLAGMMSLLGQIRAEGVAMDTFLYNTVIGAFARRGDLENAVRCFAEMKETNVRVVLSAPFCLSLIPFALPFCSLSFFVHFLSFLVPPIFFPYLFGSFLVGAHLPLPLLS